MHFLESYLISSKRERVRESEQEGISSRYTICFAYLSKMSETHSRTHVTSVWHVHSKSDSYRKSVRIEGIAWHSQDDHKSILNFDKYSFFTVRSSCNATLNSLNYVYCITWSMRDSLFAKYTKQNPSPSFYDWIWVDFFYDWCAIAPASSWKLNE